MQDLLNSNQEFKCICVSGSYTLPPQPPAPPPKDAGVQEFFEMLGYKVSWDRNGYQCWFELYDDGLVAQVDMGVPLDVIVEDMIAWHLGKEPEDRPDKPDWACCAEDGPELKELFRRVYNFKTFNQMPDGQINLGI
jgi:hypothetical protein